jgi:oligopeptide transport system substrate-binding protein
MLRLLVPFALLLAAIGVVAVTDRPLPKADFTCVNRGEITTLDLQRMSWMHDLRAAKLLWEGLTTNDPFTWDYAVKPAAADRWEVSPDRRMYTFHIREAARWSNGDRVRAGDFVFSWRRELLPDTAADFTGMMMLVKGGKAFFDWRTAALAEFAASRDPGKSGTELWQRTLAKFDEMVGVHAPDDSTLVVELEHPTPYFLDLCGFPPFFPSYPPLVRQYERPDPETGRIESRRDWSKPGVLVSNGPFVLKVWRFHRDMRLEKSPTWWNRDSLAIDSINIPSVEDLNAQVLAFQTGAIDWLAEVGARYKPEMLADKMRFYDEHRAEYEALKAQGLDQFEIDRRLPPDPRKNIHAIPTFGTYFYNFNCLPRLRDGRPNPFADPRVRRAFTMAIDKATLVDEVQRTGNAVATTLIPAGSLPGYESPKGLPFDPAAARRLLAEAGYPSGASFPVTVEILFNKEGDHAPIAEFVGKNWEEYLGVQVSLVQKELRAFRDDLKNANFMVSRAGWYGDYMDPTSFLDPQRTGDGNNDRKYSSAEFDGLMARAAEETDAPRRLALLAQAESLIVDRDLPLAPLFQYVTLYLFDASRISGINCHPRTDQHLYLIDVLGDGKGPDRPRTMPPRADKPAPQHSSAAAHGADGAFPPRALPPCCLAALLPRPWSPPCSG